MIDKTDTIIVAGASGESCKINLKELTSILAGKLEGGGILVFELNSDSPIFCNSPFCDELAEYLALVYATTGELMQACYCLEHQGEHLDLMTNGYVVRVH